MPVTGNVPMIFLFDGISIIIAITRTATIPLMTALQKSALTGSSGETPIAIPMNVAMTMAP